MALSDVNLHDLVTELRKRLHPFMAGVSAADGPVDTACVVGGRDQPGTLGPAGRASLAARLLAVELGHRHDPVLMEVAGVFNNLAEALINAPPPSPGSELETGLQQLTEEFEAMAMAWDMGTDNNLLGIWSSLRDLGDSLWLPTEKRPTAKKNEETNTVGATAMEDVHGRTLWLLISGRLRRDTLRHRLVVAGWSVLCLIDGAEAATRLARERPAAIICDDAAPARHGSRLQRLLPPAAPPVIMLRHRTPKGGCKLHEMMWLPPFKTEDLSAKLNT